MNKFTRYMWNWLILIDQAFNVLFGGDPDETISSRMGKLVAKDRCKFCKWTCRALDFIDPGHCKKSVELDRGKRTIIK